MLVCQHIKTFFSVWRRFCGRVGARHRILHLRENLAHYDMQYQRVRRNHLPMHKRTPLFCTIWREDWGINCISCKLFWENTVFTSRATERISEVPGQKRKMRLLESEANRNFLESRNRLRRDTVGSLYETPRPWNIGWYKAPWSLRPWEKLPPAPFSVALDLVSTV